jgi:uncharacterized protein (TIGR03083 family)
MARRFHGRAPHARDRIARAFRHVEYRDAMVLLTFSRYCDEIVAQTDLLRAGLDGADLAAPVPSCPAWNLDELLRHLGGAHRWVETIVRTRATRPPSDEQVRNVSGHDDDDPAALGAWLAEGAARLSDALRAAGPDAKVWTPMPGGNPMLLARRMAHETVIHRADAALALGAEFTLAPEVAADALDEWMELGSLPQIFRVHPERRELLGPGRTVHLHATDTAPEVPAEWVVDLTGEAIGWRRAHEKATVAARGPLTDLLLLVYRRRAADAEGIEVLGETGFLDFWLERVGFG